MMDIVRIRLDDKIINLDEIEKFDIIPETDKAKKTLNRNSNRQNNNIGSMKT